MIGHMNINTTPTQPIALNFCFMTIRKPVGICIPALFDGSVAFV